MLEYIDLTIPSFWEYGALIGCFILIAGFIILIRKDSATKFLGLWLIFEGICNILAMLSYKYNNEDDIFSFQLRGPDVATALLRVKVCLSLGGVLFLLLYAYFRYHSKAFIPAVIVKCIQIVISPCWESYFYEESFSGNSVKTKVDALLLVVIAAITFYAFFKNRKKEENLKKIYRVPLFHLIYIFVVALNWNLLFVSPDGFLYALEGFLVLVLSAALKLIPLIAAIYILSGDPKGKTTENKKILLWR